VQTDLLGLAPVPCRQLVRTSGWLPSTSTCVAGRGLASWAAGEGAKKKGFSFADVMSLRENLVMRNHEKASQIGLLFGHAGYFMGLLEYGVTDIILLRVFAIGCCGLVVGFQLLQPRVQWVSAVWCGIYVAVNVVQLALLLGVTPPSLSWEEEDLHARLAHQITAVQFHSLMALGEFCWLVDGAMMAEEGTDRDSEGRLLVLTDGLCRVAIGGEVVAELGPGSVVGEIGLVTSTPASCATVSAAGSVRCFSVPVRSVVQLLEEQPEMKRPLERIFASSLAAKVRSMNERVHRRNYRAVLEVACSVDGHEGISGAVEESRRRHGISYELHEELMDELSQCVHRPFRRPHAASVEPSRPHGHTEASAGA